MLALRTNTRSPDLGGSMIYNDRELLELEEDNDPLLEFEMPAWLVVWMCLVIGFLLGAALT